MSDRENQKASQVTSEVHAPSASVQDAAQGQTKSGETVAPAAAESSSSPAPLESGDANAAASASPKDRLPSKDVREESTSRKRDREGSVEPSASAAAAASTAAGQKHTAPRSSDIVPPKKNRIIEAADEDAQQPSGEADKEKVGQIRRRVEELSYEERESKRADTGATRKSSESIQAPGAAAASKGAEEPLDKAAEGKGGPDVGTPVSPTASTPRKQPTFSSFSSSSSPFASSSASAGVSGPSWLAGSSSSSTSRSGGISGSTGALRPSSLGQSSSESTPASQKQGEPPVAASSAAPRKPASSAGLGFGAFAGSRPFNSSKNGTPEASSSHASPADTTTSSASDSPAAAAAAGTPDKDSQSGQTQPSKTALSSLAAGAKTSVFDQQVTTEEGDEDESQAETNTPNGAEGDADSTTKVKVQRKADAELATGEEDEKTVHSVRARLYAIMKESGEGAASAADGQWKERGTGTVRVNVPKDYRYGKSASVGSTRLVMRAEGVLRLILNVALFPGMKVELAQDRFVRFVGLEDGKLVHFALRVPNPAAAGGLFQAIRSRVPPANPSTGDAATEA